MGFRSFVTADDARCAVFVPRKCETPGAFEQSENAPLVISSLCARFWFWQWLKRNRAFELLHVYTESPSRVALWRSLRLKQADSHFATFARLPRAICAKRAGLRLRRIRFYATRRL